MAWAHCATASGAQVVRDAFGAVHALLAPARGDDVAAELAAGAVPALDAAPGLRSRLVLPRHTLARAGSYAAAARVSHEALSLCDEAPRAW